MKIILSVAAGLALATTSYATPDTTTSWSELDSEIAQLSTNLVEPDGVTMTGFIRAYFNNDSDNNMAGWGYEHLRLEANGKVENMKFRLSTELKSGSAGLADAWVKWELADGVWATAGNFKQPFLYGLGYLRGANRLMVKATASADNGKREPGFMLNGKAMEKSLAWNLAMMNGKDGATDEQSFYGRVAYNFLGEGGFGKFEGAIGAPEELGGTLALAFNDDQDDILGGDRMAIEAAVQGKRMYFHAEMVDYDDAFAGADKTTGKALMDTSPMALTGSYLFADDMEVALRFEDFDDVSNSERLTLGLNYYMALPHRIKWQLNYRDLSSDDAVIESEVISVGLTMAF